MGVTEQLVANPDLDASRIDLSEVLSRNAPVPAAAARANGFQAVFRRMALEEIHQHGRADTSVEICGVLVGNVYHDASGPWLYVEAIIRGDAAEGSAGQVTFKAATWEHIHREMESKHPEKRIIGWYHTHPGFGIFLSGMDLFIQDNFFNLPWQVAFVYDPIGGDEGSFVWRAGKSEREPFVVDESITIDESWSLASHGSHAVDVGIEAPVDRRGFGAWVNRLEPKAIWTAAAIGVVVALVLAGLGFALLYGAK